MMRICSTTSGLASVVASPRSAKLETAAASWLAGRKPCFRIYLVRELLRLLPLAEPGSGP